MKVVLSTLNARFTHSSLSLRYLKSYAKNYKSHIHIREFSINNKEHFIFSELYREQADILGFSCYIWNIECILKLVNNIKKVLPNTIIILGGPEVSFNSDIIKNNKVDIVVSSESEKTFESILKFYIDKKGDLASISGITYYENGVLVENDLQNEYIDLDEIPFVYEDGIEELENKIIYYESSRGCPFSCSYCMSSVKEKKVRFLSESRYKKELDFFLKKQVKQVKFIDRTFNCNKKHAMKIWSYLIENDNNYTNFHFEIAGDLLDEDIISLLKKARKGLFQFEIGVQSTNLETLSLINRETDLNKLFENIEKLKANENIHLHLDLIAGLPAESFESFKKSFNDVYLCYAEQLQLGFLKLLHGSKLREDAEKFSIVFKNEATYEVLFTKDLTFDEILILKDIEEILELYYNSGKFKNTLIYIMEYFEPFEFFDKFSKSWVSTELHQISHNTRDLYNIIYKFLSEQTDLNLKFVENLLYFDLCLNENVINKPENFYEEKSDDEKKLIYNFIRNYPGNEDGKLNRKLQVEKFSYNVFLPKKPIEEKTYVVFDYSKKTGEFCDFKRININI